MVTKQDYLLEILELYKDCDNAPEFMLTLHQYMEEKVFYDNRKGVEIYTILPPKTNLHQSLLLAQKAALKLAIQLEDYELAKELKQAIDEAESG